MASDQNSVPPDPVTAETYRGLDGRLIRLEEWRSNHSDDHEKNVATRYWVEHRMVIFATGVATIIASVVAAIMRLLT